MKPTETGKDKVKKICEVLRKETLEPAQKEAFELLQKSREEAEAIIAAARKEAEVLRAEARKEIERKKAVFDASLKQASQQAIESLKQVIMDKLFNPMLAEWLSKPLQETKTLAKLIETIVAAIEKQGIEGDISAYVATSVPAREVSSLLAPKVLERLREKGVLAGGFAGGVEIKMHKANITLDMSENAMRELVASYVRKDFRSMLFGDMHSHSQ
jgi:V/A-type H+-transporting ATPase subunit E